VGHHPATNRRPRRRRLLVAGAAALAAVSAGASPAAAAGSARVLPSPFGSGDFGRWQTDRFGLPAYQYTGGPASASMGPTQPGGASEIEHQLGNDHVVANAADAGYVELWSQDRLYQWVNHYDAATQHFAGGYGYLKVGGQVVADLARGLPRDATLGRVFGTGYSEKDLRVGGMHVEQRTYAPFGDDPILLDDVVITNAGPSTKTASWFEYWDVNPYDQTASRPRGMAAPTWNPTRRTLTVAQTPDGGDSHPLSIYGAALSGPLAGYTTSTSAFFGAGAPATPAAVAADALTPSVAPPVANGATGTTLFAFRSPVRLAPGQSITLRYAYGAADPAAVPRLVARYAARAQSFAASERAWARWVPRVSVGSSQPWLGRELAWDAYLLRSGTSYEACAGAHIISQGGYYQYLAGLQEAYRDPLQFALAMVYADPSVAGQIIRYSARQQTTTGVTPYGTGPLCQAVSPGVTDDNDVWLLLAAAEYGLATRDRSFFDQQVPFSNGGTATLWQHLQLARQHQESLLGPHGDYRSEASGDWSDASSTFLQMTESTMVTAQVAAIDPLLAQLATLRGDRAFAGQLDTDAARARGVLTSDWVARGWYGRGWSANTQIGTGAIFEEPQPWAVLAGAPTPAQGQALVGNIRRYLTGVGAPAAVHGPSKIGSSQSPAANDPNVTEHSTPTVGVGDNNAVYVGGSWYALNGTLVWALSRLDGVVPGAASDAFDEYLRNTRAVHADAYPYQWDGTLSVDDVCRSYYSTGAGTCGAGLTDAYQGQIMHQPAWSLFDTIALTGVTPTVDGYDIAPHWPTGSFDVEFPTVGVAEQAHAMRGYVVVDSSRPLTLTVTIPTRAPLSRLQVQAGGVTVRFNRHGRRLTFALHPRPGQRRDWNVTW
jgi:hypothetical protein